MMRTLNVLEGELKVEVGSKVMLRVSHLGRDMCYQPFRRRIACVSHMQFASW